MSGGPQRPPTHMAGAPVAWLRRGPSAHGALSARVLAPPAAREVQPPRRQAASPCITITSCSVVPSMRTAPERLKASRLEIGGPVVEARRWVLGRRRRSDRLRWADSLSTGVAAVCARRGAGAPSILLIGSPCITVCTTTPAGTVGGVSRYRSQGIDPLLGLPSRHAEGPSSSGGGVVGLPSPPTAATPRGHHPCPRPVAWGRLPAQPACQGHRSSR